MEGEPVSGTSFSTTDHLLKAAAAIVVAEVKRISDSELRAALQVIDQSGRAIRENAAKAADIYASKAREATSAMATELERVATTLAEESRKRSSIRTRPVIISALAFASIGVTMLVSSGVAAGYIFGKLETGIQIRAETAAAAWSNSPAGRAAYALDRANAQIGGIALFSQCSGEGWYTETVHGRRMCFAVWRTDRLRAAWYLP